MAREDGPRIAPTRGDHTLPVEDVLTGRGVVVGKSGSGKSNTASVVVERLLERGYNLSVVDPEGEYHALNERYELLHVGADERCDRQVTAEDGADLAETTLSERLPVVVDTSGFLSEDEAQGLVAEYVTALFELEQSHRQPHLLVVEEMHEFLPQSGGTPPTAAVLERVGKRGRKHGLGIMGTTQRPAAVDKDFVTQCDWLVWHRLTWENDLQQARTVLGPERAADLEDFEAGEAYLMTDWDGAVHRVRFERKRTTDAGAAPSIEDYSPRRQVRATDTSRPSETAGQSSDADGDSGDTRSTSTNDTDLATLPGDGSDPDLEDLSRAELESQLKRLRRTNERLSTELARRRETGRPTEREPGAASTERGRRVGKSGPSPPPRPQSRSGVPGTLVEVVAMLVYLYRVAKYRVWVALARARTRLGR